MGDYPWFRVYSEILTDRKIERIRRMTSLRRVEIRGAWVSLLAMANDSPQRGYLMWSAGVPVSDDEICADLEMEREAYDALMIAFEKLGMIHRAECGICCSNWDQRQFKSDSSTHRVRDWREKKRRESYQAELPESEVQQPSNVAETLQQQQCNAPDPDTETEEKVETETEQTPLSLGDPPPPLIRKTMLSEEVPQPDPVFIDIWKTKALTVLGGSMGKAAFAGYIQPIQPIAAQNGIAFLGVSDIYDTIEANRCHGEKIVFALRCIMDGVNEYEFVPIQPGGT